MNFTNNKIPETQFALQLTGPEQLRINECKPVLKPGPHQILAKIEAVGLCFSDLKLLKQFSEHARKSAVVRGLAPEVLNEIPSYVPGDKPTVPGHEVTCRVVAVGDKVRQHRVGERCLVQTDYRNLRTENSNAAFGYNFEGALQEYVLLDERVVLEAESGERYLIPVAEELGASEVALVEPWACVEDSYVTVERQGVKAGGTLAVVVEFGHEIRSLRESFAPEGAPAKILLIAVERQALDALRDMQLQFEEVREAGLLLKESLDDVIYFGAKPELIELLNDKLRAGGMINVVTGGQRIGAPVSVGVGRVHYGATRWIGTHGANAAESYAAIPHTGEVREGDSILVIGAGGPMGQMHVLRNLCLDKSNLSVTGTDFDDERLQSLRQKAEPLAAAHGCTLRLINTGREPLEQKFSYIALMAPVGALVQNAIQDAAPGCIINIFAGIPAMVRQELDLDAYIEKRCFMFGTSGSTIADMKIVLNKLAAGQLNTNSSVDAVCGMAGAADGIAAVKNRSLAGKIIVYPMLRELGLTPLEQLPEKFPSVAEKLERGTWTRAAERELLRVAR